jgi:hypothetical protein
VKNARKGNGKVEIMAKENIIVRQYNSMPSWAQGVLVVAGVAAIGGIVYGVIKGAQAIRSGVREVRDKSYYIARGERRSYPLTTYDDYASTIHSAGLSWFGTNEDAIYGVFENMNNNLDVLHLMDSFGKRRIEYTLYNASLGGWLASELEDDEMDNINQILRNKEIEIQF